MELSFVRDKLQQKTAAADNLEIEVLELGAKLDKSTRDYVRAVLCEVTCVCVCTLCVILVPIKMHVCHHKLPQDIVQVAFSKFTVFSCLSQTSCTFVNPQVDILEHKEMQLKGTERRVHSLQQQVEVQQAELNR